LGIRARISKGDSIRFESCCTSKEITTRLRRKPTEWGRVFTSYLLDKGLIPKISKELKKLNSKRKKHPINKCANE
jgi:hypothetical protein